MRNVFIAIGATLVLLLCVVPVWNALALLQDQNYVFWHGKNLPLWMLGLCAGVFVVFVVTMVCFFKFSVPQAQTEQTVMMMANVFITLLGLALMLVSLPLSRQATDTYTNLMQRCDYSPETHRLFEYSQVLHNIRNAPGCEAKYSVEECDGYQDAAPYTTFLKSMESDFRCSGFCYQHVRKVSEEPAAVAQEGGNASKADDVAAALLLFRDRKSKTLQADHTAPQSVLGMASSAKDFHNPVIDFPPTLFNNGNYKASCDGMVARDIKNFAGDVSYQTFYQGIYLVLIAITTSFLKLIGFCVHREPVDKNY